MASVSAQAEGGSGDDAIRGGSGRDRLLAGDTKGAWIATGTEPSFYVWATDEGPPVKQILRRESYRFVAEVAGAKVYDDFTRTFWLANGYLFWIEAGPRGDSVAPTPTELAPLIRASRAVAPPS